MILVCKNEDEPITFESVSTLLQWIGSKTDDLGMVRDFLDGGYIRDSANNKYSLSDLPLTLGQN